MWTNKEMMRRRLEWQGGIAQEDRMIRDKYRTFLKALQYSYQGCDVSLVQPWSECLDESNSSIDAGMLVNPTYRALINPDKVKQDYDDKILSIDYKYNYGPGDVFCWVGTQTFWIIYLEQLTEDAYFRGEIRQCEHKLKFKDQNGNWCSTWAAIRGPVETQIDNIQKNQVRVDRPNLSLNILLPQNEKTIHAFDRYSEFIYAGKCWRVNAPDSISMKNIIEVNAEEYYIDRDTDDMDNEMKNGLVIEPVVDTSQIAGETFIKPQIAESYSVEEVGGIWSIKEDKAPVEFLSQAASAVELVWHKPVSGQFTLQWSKDDTLLEKVIRVESLF